MFARRILWIPAVLLLVSWLTIGQAAAAEIGMAAAANRYPEEVFLTGPHQANVALTFDDGPDGHYTPAILDILKEKKAPATFFLVGQNASAYPDVVKRIASEGHCLANHTWNHPYMPHLSVQGMVDQLTGTDNLIANIAGVHTSLFRPPYGAVSDELIATAQQLGYKVILWSVDSNDWRGYSPDRILQNIFSEVTPGAIILQHCTNSGTVNCLSTEIDTLRSEGYNLVTVPQLLGMESLMVQEPVNLVINGVAMTDLATPPFRTAAGHTMVPLDPVIQSMGYPVLTQQGDDQVLVDVPGLLSVIFHADSNIAYVYHTGSTSAAVVNLEEPAVVQQHQFMVPVHSLSQILGLELSWQEDSKTVYLNQRQPGDGQSTLNPFAENL